uniref:(northern house mosquito) hypothetical protein n=1 Tax=Culex pipiens TaxID=7175 RepID=A0A8D8AD77_CULPI
MPSSPVVNRIRLPCPSVFITTRDEIPIMLIKEEGERQLKFSSLYNNRFHHLILPEVPTMGHNTMRRCFQRRPFIKLVRTRGSTSTPPTYKQLHQRFPQTG